MVCCCVPFCKSKSIQNGSITYYPLPSDDHLRQKWLKLIYPKNSIPNDKCTSLLICSIHFKDDDFIPQRKGRHLKSDACPSIFTQYFTYKSPKRRLLNGKQKLRLKTSSKHIQLSKTGMKSSKSLFHPIVNNKTVPSIPVNNTCEDVFITLRSISTQTTDELLKLTKIEKAKIAYKKEIFQLNKKLSDIRQEYENIEVLLKHYEESKQHQYLKCILNENSNEVTAGAFLLDQIANYSEKQSHWSPYSINVCDAWLASSPKSYYFAKKNIMKLPRKKTIKKLIEVNSRSIEKEEEMASEDSNDKEVAHFLPPEAGNHVSNSNKTDVISIILPIEIVPDIQQAYLLLTHTDGELNAVPASS